MGKAHVSGSSLQVRWCPRSSFILLCDCLGEGLGCLLHCWLSCEHFLLLRVNTTMSWTKVLLKRNKDIRDVSNTNSNLLPHRIIHAAVGNGLFSHPFLFQFDAVSAFGEKELP